MRGPSCALTPFLDAQVLSKLGGQFFLCISTGTGMWPPVLGGVAGEHPPSASISLTEMEGRQASGSIRERAQAMW